MLELCLWWASVILAKPAIGLAYLTDHRQPGCLPDIWCLGAGETPNGAVSFMDAGELLQGAVSVAELVTSDLTISSEQVNVSTLEVDGDSNVLAGQAVQFTVTGSVAGRLYKLLITASTDGGQTLEFIQHLAVL